MNIIDALQALKDGKKIRKDGWRLDQFVFLSDAYVRGQDGMLYCIGISGRENFETKWEIYSEPIKLTAEERKALELAKACGYDLLWYDACFLWAHVRGKDEAKVADDDFPPLRALKGLFPRATNPTSIDSLLEETT